MAFLTTSAGRPPGPPPPNSTNPEDTMTDHGFTTGPRQSA